MIYQTEIESSLISSMFFVAAAHNVYYTKNCILEIYTTALILKSLYMRFSEWYEGAKSFTAPLQFLRFCSIRKFN